MDQHVDGWHVNWWERFQSLLHDGMQARVEIHLSDWGEGLWMMRLHPATDPALWAPRFGATRLAGGLEDWHISLAEPAATPVELIAELVARWQDRNVLVQFEGQPTSGGTLKLAGVLKDDPIVQELHRLGWYSDRDLHVSF
jgi:hypothetical protein